MRTKTVSAIVPFLLASITLAVPGCSSFNFGGKEKPGLLDRLKGGLNRESEDDILADEALDPLGRRDGNRLLVDDLTPSQIGTTLKVRTSMAVDQDAAKQAFAKAESLYNSANAEKAAGEPENLWQTKFVEAANQYRLAAAKWPDSSLEEQAIFFEGESYFFADRYVQANRAFERLIAQYSGSAYLDKAEGRRYAISKYWLELSESGPMISFADPKRPRFNVAGEARRVLHNIRLDDPTGKLSDDATFELASAFLKAGQFYEAADTYEDLRRNYPGSRYLFDAHMLELEARLKSYNGPSYDPTPLEKSKELVKTIVQQFPDKARKNEEVLKQQAALVNNQLAQRSYELAKYHERRKEHEAARLCYAEVATKFSDSIYASSVRDDIARVAALPATPGQEAEWFVNMFPSPEVDKPLLRSGDSVTLRR